MQSVVVVALIGAGVAVTAQVSCLPNTGDQIYVPRNSVLNGLHADSDWDPNLVVLESIGTVHDLEESAAEVPAYYVSQ